MTKLCRTYDKVSSCRFGAVVGLSAMVDYNGKSLPVVITVSLPGLVPLAAMTWSAIFRINANRPRTMRTSRPL
jgi:hypothetical protein